MTATLSGPTPQREASGGAVGRHPITRTAIASHTMSGHRLVSPRLDGQVEYADCTRRDDKVRPVWLTLGAAAKGAEVEMVVHGVITEPSWSWPASAPLYLGAEGRLTTEIYAAASFVYEVARVDTPTSLMFDPKIPIALAEEQ